MYRLGYPPPPKETYFDPKDRNMCKTYKNRLLNLRHLKSVLLLKIQPDYSLTRDRVENKTFLKTSFGLTRFAVPWDAFGTHPASFYSQRIWFSNKSGLS